MKENTLFRIANGKEDAHVVYTDETACAFLDIDPKTPGHTLIVPKAKCVDIMSLTPEQGSVIFTTAQKITKALRQVFAYEGVVLHQVNGQLFQEYPQFHLHVYGITSQASTPPRSVSLSRIAEQMKQAI